MSSISICNARCVAALLVIAGIVAAGAVAQRVQAQTVEPPTAADAPDPATPDQPARAVLARMAQTYRDMATFSTTLLVLSGTPDDPHKVTTRVSFARGKGARVVTTTADKTATFIFDGTNVYAFDSSVPKTITRSVPSNAAAGIERATSSAGLGLLPSLLNDPDAGTKVLPPTATNVELEPKAESVDGTSCDAVSAQFVAGGDAGPAIVTLRIDVGRSDHLLYRVRLTSSTAGKQQTITESYKDIKPDPKLDPAQFAFTPPADATIVPG
jgi:outer membrane lipoprotein-sorting protein